MKLPNFFSFAPLTEAKRKMGIAADQFGSLEVVFPVGRLTPGELETITKEGIDVNFGDLTILPDGTFALKDRRVLIYIRDVRMFRGDQTDPRFHLFNCSKIDEMTASGKFERYVASARTDGLFEINVIQNYSTPHSDTKKLAVCRLCLSGLSYENYGHHLSPRQRQDFVDNFSIDEFFARYPSSLHAKEPDFDSENAPIDDYTADFPFISRWVREGSGWTCEKCKRILASARLRKFLHVHHIGGRRSDNRRGNLKVLCIACHSNEPKHQHLRNSPQYSQYLAERQ